MSDPIQKMLMIPKICKGEDFEEAKPIRLPLDFRFKDYGTAKLCESGLEENNPGRVFRIEIDETSYGVLEGPPYGCVGGYGGDEFSSWGRGGAAEA